MDTTKLGAVSGTVGAIASIIPGLLEKNILKLAKLTFLDYASVLTVGHQATDIWHWLIAAIGHIIFGATLGVIFAFFIKKTGNDESLILKGCGFGILIWLITLGVATLYKMPHFTIIDPSDCFFILVDAVVYGLVTSFTYQWLFKKASSRS